MTTFLLFILVILIAVSAVGYFMMQKRHKDLEASEATIKEEISFYRARLEPLRRFEVIENAETEAKRIYAESQTEIKEAKLKAKSKIDTNLLNAQQTLDSAIAESKNIVSRATENAQEIAGSALLAKNNEEQYRKAARAMKNVIEGYGDQYVIPNRSVLDDLAEEYSHKQAGVQLKQARIQTKSMVKNRQAATCDYVEENRKKTAILFILDAFNGKVDSALSEVKYNNFGKLKQEILDAFDLVNHNGAAFRNARIESEYLQARQNELQWAVAACELQKLEKEEQRQIKEAMREEEKARREFEKAKREAEKEEKLLKNAMEEAQKKIESATSEDRIKLEGQIAELQSKLAEVEEKEKRALSMAQQTKQGHVYVISNEGSFGPNVYKIGLTRRLEPLDRVKELGDASVPFEFDVHAMIHADHAPNLESELHRKFQSSRLNKINHRKEFFRASISQIRETVEALGIEAHWTMLAEAREFRESLALEESKQAGFTEVSKVASS